MEVVVYWQSKAFMPKQKNKIKNVGESKGN